jgi:hypothetical protein
MFSACQHHFRDQVSRSFISSLEVAAAGHDRCIVPIREKNIDAWLNPNLMDLPTQMAILDDRERPYYEHQVSA